MKMELRVSPLPRIVLLASVLAACPDALLARGKGGVPDFDVSAFSANEDTARWLLAYDFVAWKASDLVMEEPADVVGQLGSEWFCFHDAEGSWHALFGRYDPAANSYRQVFHYVRRDDSVIRTEDVVDESLAAKYGGAIYTALAQLPPAIRNLGVRFNTYVRPVEADKLEVWFLPAGQQDNTLIFGGDVRFLLDSTGREVLQQQANFKEFRGVHPGSSVELNIDRPENEVPSVGDIFFILQFGHQFKSVSVWTHCFLTRMINDEGKEIAWLHVQRSTRDCKKKHAKRSGGSTLNQND
jgi:hypothetical protein